MIKSLPIIVLFLFLTSACSTSKQATSGQEFLPTIYFDGKNLNDAIYDYDPWESDVRTGEFLIKLSEIQYAGDILKIEGIVLDKDSEKALNGVIIKITDSKKNTLKEMNSDSAGFFNITSNYQSGSLLEFRSIGFRTIWIDVSDLTIQAKN